MDRNEFEVAARTQNEQRATKVAEARRDGAACDVEVMLALGGVPYCRTHRVMGPCPYAPAAAAVTLQQMVQRGAAARRLLRALRGGAR